MFFNWRLNIPFITILRILASGVFVGKRTISTKGIIPQMGAGKTHGNNNKYKYHPWYICLGYICMNGIKKCGEII